MIERRGRGDFIAIRSSRIVTTNDAPLPAGPYSQGVVAGEFIFCSGQIGMDPVSGSIVPGGVMKEMERAILNLSAVLVAAGADLDAVVKVTLFLRNMADFPAVNEVYMRFLGGAKPARSTVEVSALPRGALVEIDAVARVR